MACSKFEDWLSHQTSKDWLHLSEEMNSHCRTCAECSETIKAAKTLRKEFQRFPAPPSRLDHTWQKISSRIDIQTVPRFQAWNLFAEGLKAKWSLGFSLACCLTLALVIFWNVKRDQLSLPGVEAQRFPASLILGTLHSSGGKLNRQARDILLGTGDLALQPEDELLLLFPSSKGKIHFQDDSRVELIGSCKIRFAQKEFQIVSGDCRVSLSKGRDTLRIRVPGAILAIRGTVLQVKLQASGGTIDLLEGIVDVEPTAGSRAPFAWKAGTRLSFQGNSLAGGPENIPPSQISPSTSPTVPFPAEPVFIPDQPHSTGSIPHQSASTGSSNLKSVLTTK